MSADGTILLTLGGVFLLGLAADLVGRATFVPRIALLVTMGIAIGPGGLNILGPITGPSFVLITDIALVMVGFLVGGTLKLSVLRQYGRAMIASSVIVTLATFIAVTAATAALGFPLAVALVLGAVATATDPAATLDVVRESRAEGPLSVTLRGIVALDDAWALVIFTIAMTCIKLLDGSQAVAPVLAAGLYELGGAVLLGAVLGVSLAYLTGRISDGEPTVAEALGMVFLCAGLAKWLEVSFLLSAIVMGGVVVNLAQHHRRPFHAVEGIEWPFLIIFFVLSGASLRFDGLFAASGLLVLYLVARLFGRVLGGVVSAWAGGLEPQHGRWLGLALLPQAGVALGMVLVASESMPDLGEQLLPVVIGATVLMETTGPVLTRLSLARCGETGRVERKGSRDAAS